MPEKATEYESVIKQHFNQRHCWQGISGNDRNEISIEIIKTVSKN